MILHFSGHGLVKGEIGAPEDALVIEKVDLKADLFTESKIAEIFGNHSEDDENCGIQLAVVLSCHSEKVGRILMNKSDQKGSNKNKSSIKHVICIKRDEEIADKACLIFVRTFYHYLLNGNWNSICKSFKEGTKAVIENLSAFEADKFLCLCDHKAED